MVAAEGKRQHDDDAGDEVEQGDADEEGHGAAGEDQVGGGDEHSSAECSSHNTKDNRIWMPVVWK